MYKLVIADDEIKLRQSLKNDIDWSKYGFEISGEAGDGDEAERIVLALKPDLLLIDICMPGKTGLEVIANVRKQLPALQIVIVSAYDSFDYARQAMFYSVAGYLLKPIDSAELDSVMGKVTSMLLSGQTYRKLDDKEILINKIRAFIDLHYTERISLETLAETNYISASRLSNLFTKYTGLSFTDYITNKRIDEAKRLLRASSLSISEISVRIGYDDVSYFCRVFKKSAGLTPFSYRIGAKE